MLRDSRFRTRIDIYRNNIVRTASHIVMPGIGLIKRRLEKEEQAVALAVSHILKEYDQNKVTAGEISTLETKYDTDSGDWYVALGWREERVVIQMDSILGTVTNVRSI